MADNQNNEKLSHEEKVELFKETVLDVMDGEKQVVFLDTEKITNLPAEERAAEVAAEIKAQSPELYNKIMEMGQEKSAEIFSDLGRKPNELTASAYLLRDFKDVTVISTPSKEMDEIKEFLPNKDVITDLKIDIDAFPATDREMIMYNAAHEAAHAKFNDHDSMKEANKSTEGLIGEEARADDFANNYLKQKGNADIGPAFQQIRAIEYLLHGQVGDHATAGFSSEDAGKITPADLKEIEETRKIMDQAVEKATGNIGLYTLLEDPQKYAEIVRDTLIKNNPNGLSETQLEKVEILNKAIDTYLKVNNDPIQTPDMSAALSSTQYNDASIPGSALIGTAATIEIVGMSLTSAATNDPSITTDLAATGFNVDPEIMPSQIKTPAPALQNADINSPFMQKFGMGSPS